MSRSVVYRPHYTLRDFHASNAFIRGIRGPIGSGKSVACCWEIWTRACEQAPDAGMVRRSRWVATRNTYSELKMTTIATWLDWFPEERFGRIVYDTPITQVLRWPMDDGTSVELEMWFLALDRPKDVKKLLSLEITGMWMNEAREQPKAILDAGSGRVGRFPAKRDGTGATWSGVIMDTNPPDDDHWWYTLAEVDTPDGYAFWSQPPGDSDQAENIENLPDGYYARLTAGKSKEWIKVYVRGAYGMTTDGRPIYPEFRDELHVREFSANPRLSIFGGMDFGLTPAGVWAQRMPNGQVRVHRELVTDDMGLKRFGALWVQDTNMHYPPPFKLERITGDPAGQARNDDERTSFDVLRGEKVKAEPASTNSFTLRREAVAAMLTKIVDGEPALIIHPQCVRLRKAMAGGYQFKRMAVVGQERYKDEPDKNMHSHVAEALQYLVLGLGGARDLRRTDDDRRLIAQHKASGRVITTPSYDVLD